MNNYSFYLDTKVTDWYRTAFEIEADSLESAKELVGLSQNEALLGIIRAEN